MRLRFTFVAAGLLAAAAVAPGEEPLTVTRHYTPADRERDRYVYVPFDVAEGTTELQIMYDYDRAGGQNTIDLGVFEPGSLDLHTTAMRGYSGGSKSEVVIGECRATPGYWPGKLPPGRWHVMLGLYQVAAAGVDVTLTVRTGQGVPCPPGGFAASPGGSGFANPPRWFSGALHTHTVHSDGTVTPEELFGRATAALLDFVAITDHNNTTHWGELQRRMWHHPAFLWIVGEEVTTPAGHANVWGLRNREWIDFRVRPQENRIGELVDRAHGYGALVSINHPVGECGGCSWEHAVPSNIDAIEVWNGRGGAQPRAVAIWQRLLQAGRRVTAVGASDWHRAPDAIHNPHVRVFARGLLQSAILEAIGAGRVIVMRHTTEPTPSFVVRSGPHMATVGESLKLSTDSGSIDVQAPGLAGGRAVVVLNGTRIPLALDVNGNARLERALVPGYIRLETYDANGEMVAFTNPVYLVR